MGSVRGSLGVLDMSSHQYNTVMRSHRDVVSDIALDPNKREFATVGGDATIRVSMNIRFGVLLRISASMTAQACTCSHRA